MKSLSKITLLITFTLFTSRSFAGPEDNGFYVWADVVDVNPVVSTDYEEVPLTHCRVEKRYRGKNRHHKNSRWNDAGRYPDSRHRESAMPALLGGLIGGAIGSRFGKGDGKRAMTVLGAFAGAGIASSAGRNHRVERVRGNRHRVCETSYELEPIEVIEGYEVTYEYLGREFSKRTDDHPGDRVKIYITVDAVDLAQI
jgi:hypothetical protein